MLKRIAPLMACLLLSGAVHAAGAPEGFEVPENYPDPVRLIAEIERFQWLDYVMAPESDAVVATGSSASAVGRPPSPPNAPEIVASTL